MLIDDARDVGDECLVGLVALMRVFDKDGYHIPPPIGQQDKSHIVCPYRPAEGITVARPGLVPQCHPRRRQRRGKPASACTAPDHGAQDEITVGRVDNLTRQKHVEQPGRLKRSAPVVPAGLDVLVHLALVTPDGKVCQTHRPQATVRPLRPAYNAKQDVTGIVVTLPDAVFQQTRYREAASPRMSVAQRTPCVCVEHVTSDGQSV